MSGKVSMGELTLTPTSRHSVMEGCSSDGGPRLVAFSFSEGGWYTVPAFGTSFVSVPSGDYLRVEADGVSLTHPAHAPQSIPRGTYKLRQKTFKWRKA